MDLAIVKIGITQISPLSSHILVSAITQLPLNDHTPPTAVITSIFWETRDDSHVELNPVCAMSTIPTRSTNLAITNICNSINILGFGLAKSRRLPAQKAQSQKRELTSQKSVQHFYVQGVKKLATQDFCEAIEKFNLALKINPNYAFAYNDRGVARYNLGDRNSALRDLDKAIELDDQNAKFYSNRAFMRGRMGDTTGALADYNLALTINPNCAKSYFSRGIIYYNFGNHAEALADFNSTISLNPNQAQAYYNRAVTRSTLGDDNGAIQDLMMSAQCRDSF